MDPPTFWLKDNDLLRFFHRNKTEMSCMENPRIFLSQLRDHDLVPEDSYRKVSRMKSKDNIKKSLYGILDWFERERPHLIKDFWQCVFKETILNLYPTLKMMRNDLMDGSFQFDIEVPQRTETEDTEGGKGKDLSEDEEGEEQQAKTVKKKRKRKVSNDEEEQAGPSSQMTPRKKSKKINFSSPRKGESKDIWTWPIYKCHLPVTCGRQKGTLVRQRLSVGEKCIVVNKQWFTPNEFQKFGGKESYKNWKLSIRCEGTPLGKLIQEGHLKAGNYKGAGKKGKKSLSTADCFMPDEEEDEEGCDLDQEDQVSSNEESFADSEEEEQTEEQTEQQPQVSHESNKMVFKVTCGPLVGTLHKKRFASGIKGKSIRTETSWMSPVEFVKEASLSTDASWRKDILYEGEPLSVLIEANILGSHSLLCECKLCQPSRDDLENQKNDDECCICKGRSESEDEEGELVECDTCPRSFHRNCHLPHVEDNILNDSSPWLCTFCVLKDTQGWLYSDEVEREAAMSRQTSQCMLQCQYLLLRLLSADEEQTFSSNPCQYLADYSKVIKTPMWLGKIADKLQEPIYKTVGEFESDLQLLFSNCTSYNRDNAEFLAMGKRLKELFDREFKNVFKIREQSSQC